MVDEKIIGSVLERGSVAELFTSVVSASCAPRSTRSLISSFDFLTF